MRRFSDFLGLHDKLVEKYLRMGRIIPPAPEKSVIGKWYENYENTKFIFLSHKDVANLQILQPLSLLACLLYKVRVMIILFIKPLETKLI
jgi:hypothetical protein